jgi:hypothetical protein
MVASALAGLPEDLAGKTDETPLMAGDRIVAVGTKKVKDIESFRDALEEEAGRSRRCGSASSAVVRKPPRSSTRRGKPS